MASLSGDKDDPQDESAPDYKPPGKKTMQELLTADKEDESLERYKRSLLGAAYINVEPPFPENPANVIMKDFTIRVEGEPDIVFDLRGDLKKYESTDVNITEGKKYSVATSFYVQRDIVCGLRYMQKASKNALLSEKHNMVLGSYGPQNAHHTWNSQTLSLPKGIVARGKYDIQSSFVDDDKNEYLTWYWRIVLTSSKS